LKKTAIEVAFLNLESGILPIKRSICIFYLTKITRNVLSLKTHKMMDICQVVIPFNISGLLFIFNCMERMKSFQLLWIRYWVQMNRIKTWSGT